MFGAMFVIGLFDMFGSIGLFDMFGDMFVISLFDMFGAMFVISLFDMFGSILTIMFGSMLFIIDSADRCRDGSVVPLEYLGQEESGFQPIGLMRP